MAERTLTIGATLLLRNAVEQGGVYRVPTALVAKGFLAELVTAGYVASDVSRFVVNALGEEVAAAARFDARRGVYLVAD